MFIIVDCILYNVWFAQLVVAVNYNEAISHSCVISLNVELLKEQKCSLNGKHTL